MTRLRKILFGIFLIVVASFVGFQWYELFAGSTATQPIKFSHKKHADAAKCEDCHTTFKTAASAGLPDISVCMGCHQGGPVTESPEEKKLLALANDKKDLSWARLYENPVHVYFSHARHVSIGKLACETCHGSIGKATAPPARALISISMDRCISCHKRNKVDTSCVTCHK